MGKEQYMAESFMRNIEAKPKAAMSVGDKKGLARAIRRTRG